MNDPNGLVFHDGEYHLYYQHHPHSTDFGPTHWGHAVSNDLVSWSDLPIALHPDERGHIYSGSVVEDQAGDAGLGHGALIAAFTHFTPTSQTQSIAGSTDRGRTFRSHPGNPVLAQPPGMVDFRDPKVVRFGGPDDGHWVMILAAGDHARLYASADLVTWTYTSSFVGAPDPGDGIWETPDLFVLPVDDSDERRWVLTGGVIVEGTGGTNGMRYWVGQFDGRTFTPDAPGSPRWVDHGADFYAAQSWSHVPDGRRIWIAWMSNWAYARRVPAVGWRGQMTVPRELRLTRVDSAITLAQRPVRELLGRFDPPRRIRARAVLEEGAGLIRFGASSAADSACGIELRWQSGEVRVVRDAAAGTLVVDRTAAADVGLGETYHTVRHAPLHPTGERVEVEVLVDRWSLEVFADRGQVVLTDLVAPVSETAAVEVAAIGPLAGPIEICPFRCDDANHRGQQSAVA